MQRPRRSLASTVGNVSTANLCTPLSKSSMFPLQHLQCATCSLTELVSANLFAPVAVHGVRSSAFSTYFDAHGHLPTLIHAVHVTNARLVSLVQHLRESRPAIRKAGSRDPISRGKKHAWSQAGPLEQRFCDACPMSHNMWAGPLCLNVNAPRTFTSSRFRFEHCSQIEVLCS